MNKRILFLAPYSIPTNNPEAICNAKLLEVLSNAGYIIDVVSKNNLSAYVPNMSELRFTSKLSSLKIFYLSNVVNRQTIWGHIRVLLKTGYVYKGAHWAYYAITYSEKLIKANHYDWIMSRSPSSELAALYLSKKFGIKWIANWNDPYPEKRMPKPYGGGPVAKLSFFERHLLKEVTRCATWHTFPSERQRCYMEQYMLGMKNVKIIPHVCLPDVVSLDDTVNEDRALRIVHSGNVSYPRDPKTFIEGVKIFILKNPKASIEIFFIGKQDSDFIRLVQKKKLTGVIKMVQPMNYMDNLVFISKNDVALLIEAPVEEGIFLPTKVGDYMQCGKEIFAVSPHVGQMHDLFNEKKIEYYADCTDAQEIASQLEKIYMKKDEYLKRKCKKEIIKEYLAESILDAYNQILNS